MSFGEGVGRENTKRIRWKKKIIPWDIFAKKIILNAKNDKETCCRKHTLIMDSFNVIVINVQF